MSVVETITADCIQELSNCQHLYTKLDPKNAEWRPAENMRPTLDLLQYLSFVGMAMSRHFTKPSEDRDEARRNYRELSKWSGEAVTFENFPEMIEREKEEMRALLSSLTDADLARPVYHPFSNEEHSLLKGLLTILRYLCAYRHQLFLYAKMCGASINTADNWYGRDSSKR